MLVKQQTAREESVSPYLIYPSFPPPPSLMRTLWAAHHSPADPLAVQFD